MSRLHVTIHEVNSLLEEVKKAMQEAELECLSNAVNIFMRFQNSDMATEYYTKKQLKDNFFFINPILDPQNGTLMGGDNSGFPLLFKYAATEHNQENLIFLRRAKEFRYKLRKEGTGSALLFFVAVIAPNSIDGSLNVDPATLQALKDVYQKTKRLPNLNAPSQLFDLDAAYTSAIWKLFPLIRDIENKVQSDISLTEKRVMKILKELNSHKGKFKKYLATKKVSVKTYKELDSVAQKFYVLVLSDDVGIDRQSTMGETIKGAVKSLANALQKYSMATTKSIDLSNQQGSQATKNLQSYVADLEARIVLLEDELAEYRGNGHSSTKIRHANEGIIWV